ncbi:MAG: hypothetical protein ACP5RR_02005 [Candidatus Kapaibacteriota bacterium]
MIKLKISKKCLYYLTVEQMELMLLRKFFTNSLLLLLFTILSFLSTFSQTSDIFYNYKSETTNIYPFYYPFDSCIYFPENLFTIGSFHTGIKFAQSNLIKNQKKNNGKYYESRVENDTATKGNKIISIRETDKGDKIAIYIQTENMEQRIKLMVYNLLGKKVLDIYDGKPKDPSQPYEFSTEELPKGIFLLVVIGDNFRLREKLIITK